MKYIDETGNVYGKLTVTGKNPLSDKGSARWDCVCECGNTTTIVGSNLRSGRTKNCVDCGKKAAKRPRKGLYVMKAGVNVKIGSSDNVAQRMKTYRDILPDEPELLYWNPTLGHHELLIHDVFELGYHVRGEWFTRHVLLEDKLPSLLKELEEDSPLKDVVILNKLTGASQGDL